MILLSIQIPTTEDRRHLYAKLEEEIRNQCVALGEEPFSGFLAGEIQLGGWRSSQIEFMYYRDNKEISIGEKRNVMYQHSTGLYSWMIDDDDFIAPNAVRKILKALETRPDCVTFREKVTIDGVEKLSSFNLGWDDWAENVDGFDYVRTPFFKTPILTGLCQKVGVKDMRFGEDHDFAQRIKPWLQSSVHIPEQLYWYQHESSEFKTRYGITE